MLRRQSRRTEGIAGEAAKQVEAAQAEHERKIKAIRRSHLAEQTSLRKELTKAVGAREAARAEHKAANEATDRTVTKLKADLVEAKSVCRAWTNKIRSSRRRRRRIYRSSSSWKATWRARARPRRRRTTS